MSDDVFEDEPTSGHSQPRGARQPNRETPREDPPRRPVRRFSDLGNIQVRTRVGGQNDIVLTLLAEAITQSVDHESPTLNEDLRRNKYGVLQVPAKSDDSSPALLITLPVQKAKAVYLLILEREGVLPTRPRQDGGDTYESLVLTTDQLNARYIENFKTQLTGGEGEVYIVGHQVITQEVVGELRESADRKDTRLRDRAAGLLNNAIDALAGWRDNFLSDRDIAEPTFEINVDTVDIRAGQRLELTFEQSNQPKRDTGGIPIRNDLLGRLSLVSKNNDIDDEDDTMSRFDLAEIAVGIDLYLDQSDDDAPRSSWGRSRRRERDYDRPFLQAVIDITHLTSLNQTPFNLDTALLLLGHTTLLTNNHNWVRGLRPRAAQAAGRAALEPITDLGWLNLYNPDTERATYVSDLTGNVSDTDLNDYLSLIVNDEVTIGMTIPASGEKSWVLNIFERIALTTSPAERKELIDIVYSTADRMTDGEFFALAENTELMDRDFVPVISNGTREMIGVWEDANGNVRPASEWNLVAMATAAKDRLTESVLEFQQTYEDNGRSADFNMSVRWDLVRRFCQGLRVVDSAEKLIFAPIFLKTLSQAIANTESLDPYLAMDSNYIRRRNTGQTRYAQFATRDAGVNNRRRGRDNDRKSGNQRGFYSSNWKVR